MQTTKEKIMYQQLVMFHLGYYKGIIDGIWSTATIDAKKRFESDEAFLPAYPNLGLPFGERDKLPKKMRYDEKGRIRHVDLPDEKIAEILKAMEARAAANAPKVENPEGEVGPIGSQGLPGDEGVDGIGPACSEGEVGLKGPDDSSLAGPSREEAERNQQAQQKQHGQHSHKGHKPHQPHKRG